MKILGSLLLALLIPATVFSAQPVGPEIRNDAFDLGENGVPIDWIAHPGPDGNMTKFETGEAGFTIVDIDPARAAGLGQWIQVEGGHTYKATLATEGEGNLTFAMNFTTKIPPKIGQALRTSVLEWKSTVKAGQAGVIEGVIPAEAAYAWISISSPMKATTDTRVIIKSVKVEDLGAAPADSVPAAATPTPKP